MIGIVYRPALRVELFREPSAVDYVEIVAEDFLNCRGAAADELDALASTFTVVVHALGLSIGSAEGVDRRYVERLARLVERVRAPWWSDHLAFTRAGGIDVGHFVPLRADAAGVEIVARNAAVVRQTIATPFALENPARPFAVGGAALTAGAFLAAVAASAGCRILLDVENLQADERNLAEPADAVIDALDPSAIAEIHVAGGRCDAGWYLDSHDAAVGERTWALLERAARRGAVPAVTLERDGALTTLAALRPELERARAVTTGCAA